MYLIGNPAKDFQEKDEIHSVDFQPVSLSICLKAVLCVWS